jgi:hypothetical protein
MRIAIAAEKRYALGIEVKQLEKVICLSSMSTST